MIDHADHYADVLARDGAVHVELVAGDSPHTFAVTMIAPDRRGLLSKAAGVLALNALSVHSASVNSAQQDGVASAINTFVVSPHFGSPPAAELIRQQFILALNGELDAIGSLQKRDREAAQYGTERAGEPKPAVPAAAPAPPRILWHAPDPNGRQLVEIRASDRTGLLAVLTGVFEKAGIDIAWAKITTVGSSVIDVFAITAPASRAAREALDGHDDGDEVLVVIATQEDGSDAKRCVVSLSIDISYDLGDLEPIDMSDPQVDEDTGEPVKGLQDDATLPLFG